MKSSFLQNPFNPEKVKSANNPDFGFVDNKVKEENFKKAARHSRQVKLLKYLLPSIGVAVIALVVIILVLWQQKSDSIFSMSAGIKSGKLVMQNPELNGFNEKKRHYSVKAVRAVQSVEDPTQVRLDQIQAKLPIGDSFWANISAGKGKLYTTNKKLQLGEGVDVITTNDMEIRMNDAYIDLKAGTLKTDNSIIFNSNRASVSSRSLKVFENGERIVFDTDVRLIIQSPTQNPESR